jgi:lysophospholipase L1-like esterase
MEQSIRENRPNINIAITTNMNTGQKMNTKLLFLLFTLTLTSVFLLTTDSNSATIIAFGDSITAGHSSRSGGYPPKLNSLLNENNKPSIVINKGVSGEKTPEGVGRIGRVLAGTPSNLILIMEGTNDIRGGLSVETTRHNLESMINQSKAAGVTPVLATLTPSDRNGSATVIPKYWNPMIKSLASGTSIPLADQYAAILPTWGSSNADGLHPNDTGYWTVARTWYGVIAPMISSTGEVNPGAGSGGGGSSGPCFIATAAFGSPVEKHVTLLKEFRDNFLLTNRPGKLFVKTYYTLSPPLADFISRHENLKLVVRILLYPLIGFSYVLLKLNLTAQLFIAVMLMGGLGFSMYFIKRRPETIS